MSFTDWFTKAPNPTKVQQTEATFTSRQLSREVSSHSAKGLTPAQLASILQTAETGYLTEQAQLFVDMEDNDAHLSAELMKRKMACKQLDWSLNPVRNASASEKNATQELEDLLKDELDLNAIKMDMLDAIGHGYSCLELEWGRNAAGVWLPVRIEHRSPTWFVCPMADRNRLNLRGENTLTTGGEMQEGTPLQPFGWIPHIHKARSGYLPRAGLHRVLAWSYLYKLWAGRDLAEYLELFGVSMRLGKFPPGTSQAAQEQLQAFVQGIGHRAAGVIPEAMQVEILQGVTSGNIGGFQAMIDWCEACQSKAILGGTLTSQTGVNGNRSLGDVHNEVRMDIRNDDADQIDRSLSDFLVYPIAVINGFLPPGRTPDFVSDTQEPDDLALYADAIPKLVAIGAKISKAFINEKLKIPTPEEGEELLVLPGGTLTTVPTEGKGGTSPPNPPPADLPLDDTETPPSGLSYVPLAAAKPVTGLAENLDDTTQETMDRLIATIRQAVNRAESLEALRDELVTLYGDLDTATLTSLMQMAFATADLAGRYDVQREAGAI